MNLAVGAATALAVVNTVIYVRDLLGASRSGLAIALACYGGGSMLIALTVPRVLRSVADRTVVLTGASAISDLTLLRALATVGGALAAASGVVGRGDRGE